MEKLRDRVNVRLVNYLKCASKPSYIRHKIFDNNLIAILALKINKSADIGMCILKLSKVLMYEFHYDYIKNKYDNKSNLLFIDTDILMNKIKIKDVYENFRSNKEMSDFSDYLTKSKCYDNSNKLVTGKTEDETGGVEIEKFVGPKPKMYSFLVDNNEYKKGKSLNKNVPAAIIHNEYKDVLLNNKCTRHSMN